jgi:hypothetical protein
VLIGHYAKKTWVIDASAPVTLTGKDTLSVALKGSTVSVSLNGYVVAGHAFNAATVDGSFGLMARAGAADFDDVKVKTDDRQFSNSPGSNLMASESFLVSDTASTLTQAELDSATVTAISQWVGELGDGDQRLANFGSMHVTVADLAGDALGYSEGRNVWIDADAAGYGWSLYGGSMDLATAVSHELGHVLGFAHEDEGVMLQELAPVAPSTRHDERPAAFDFQLAGSTVPGTIDWQLQGTDSWSSRLSPYAAAEETRASSNFSDYLVRPSKASERAGEAGFDALGKALLGSKAGKGGSARS